MQTSFFIAKERSAECLTQNHWRRVHSASTDPFFNHALEEWLFRHALADAPILYTCTSAPGVVIGRNQVPWRECHLEFIRDNNLFFSRRSSGGGAVYQDFGNANFSIIAPRKIYDSNRHLNLAAVALKKMGISARVVENRGLFCEDRKVSGSAFMITGRRTIQHATMLVDADLSMLRAVLRKKTPPMDTRAVASVPAHVANLTQFNPGLSVDDFYESLTMAFLEQYSPGSRAFAVVGEDSDVCQTDEFYKCLEKYRAQEWIIGHTPKFSYTLEVENRSGLRLAVEKGRITNVERWGEMANIDVTEHLIGRTFAVQALKNMLQTASRQNAMVAKKINRQLTEDW